MGWKGILPMGRKKKLQEDFPRKVQVEKTEKNNKNQQDMQDPISVGPHEGKIRTLEIPSREEELLARKRKHNSSGWKYSKYSLVNGDLDKCPF